MPSSYPHTRLITMSLLATLPLGTFADTAAFAPTPPARLLSSCTRDTPAEQRFCQGYLSAAADASGACIPPGINFTTIQDLALSTLRDIPVGEDATTATLLGRRLAGVFPCGDRLEREASDGATDAPQGRSPNWSNKDRFGK